MLLTANTGVPQFGIPLMPRAYTRKYQKELEDILYFLLEYPELRHLLKSEESRWVEKRRQQLINWLWRQMGREDNPPLLDENIPEWGDEIALTLPLPAKSTQERRLMILKLYEEWRASETGRNPGEKAKARLMREFCFKTKEAVDKYLQRARRTRAAVDHKNVDHKIDPSDIPF
jgi:hypothetical protein